MNVVKFCQKLFQKQIEKHLKSEVQKKTLDLFLFIPNYLTLRASLITFLRECISLPWRHEDFTFT